MYPLFESLCVQDGKLLNAHWHRLRFQKAFKSLFNTSPTFDLLEGIQIPQTFAQGRVKLKVLYNATERDFQFQHYKTQNIQSLRLVDSLTSALGRHLPCTAFDPGPYQRKNNKSSGSKKL
jgi:4-amino-4-deoxychorismate lyase